MARTVTTGTEPARRRRGWVLAIAAVVAVSCYAPPRPASASHAPDTGALETRWVAPGFAEGWDVAAADLNGDGDDEVIYGGRKLAALDADSVRTRKPRWSVAWNHVPEDDVLDGGDNSWVTGIEMQDITRDGVPDPLVTTSDTDAYAVDGSTGRKLWHNPQTGAGLSFGFAVVDADIDGVADMFPTGGTHAVSGATGEELWQAPIPKGARWVSGAELDGEPGRDVIIGITPPGAGTNPGTIVPSLTAKTVFAVSSTGELLYDFAPVSGVRSVVGADVTGDGVDETVVGTFNGVLYVLSRTGQLLWSATSSGAIENLVAVDVDDDGRQEILLSSASVVGESTTSHVAALDDTGAPLWTHPTGGRVATMEAVNLDDDPATELLVGGGSGDGGFAMGLETGIVTATRQNWRRETYQRVKSVAVARQDGRLLALLGSEDSHLRAVTAENGAEVWKYVAGQYVQSIDAGDLDGDGADETVTVDDSGNVIATDGRGGLRWARRADVSNNGTLLSVAVDDLDGDGRDEVAVTGWRYGSSDSGVAELFTGDGALIWSRLLPGNGEDVLMADLSGDGVKEVVVAESSGIDGDCTVSALSSEAGDSLWRTRISACLIPTITSGDTNSDGRVDIAYGDRTLVTQPHVAILEADGSTRWNLGIGQQVFWLQALPDGVVHGGYGAQTRGDVTRRDGETGAARWQTTFEADPDLGSASRFASLVPDQDGDGVFEVAASSDDGTIRLIDGGSGTERWRTPLESADRPMTQRHQTGAPVYVPSQAGRAPALIVTQYGLHRKRARTFSLSLTGQVTGSIPMEGEADGGAVPFGFPDGVLGAAVGAGLGTYAVSACAGCVVGAQPTELTLSFRRVKGSTEVVATLVDAASSEGIADVPIDFALNGIPVQEVDSDAAGRAVIVLGRDRAKAGDVVTATFAGDDSHLPAETSAPIPK